MLYYHSSWFGYFSEKENPYFELVNLATTNYYENATILPLNKQRKHATIFVSNRVIRYVHGHYVYTFNMT